VSEIQHPLIFLLIYLIYLLHSIAHPEYTVNVFDILHHLIQLLILSIIHHLQVLSLLQPQPHLLRVHTGVLRHLALT